VRGRRRAVASAVVLLAVSGCGVPLSDSAEPVSGAVQTSPSSVSTAARSAAGAVTVWYVEGDHLVPRSVSSAEDASAATALDLLATVPSGDAGLETLIADPLGGPPLATIPTESDPADAASEGPKQQRVVLSQNFNELAAQDQVLLIGQLVLTLTELDPAPIEFVDSTSSALSVPLPDGRLRDGPVTRGDYISLS
jgi:hypothetical protein